MNRGRRIFQFTCVKPVIKSKTVEDIGQIGNNDQSISLDIYFSDVGTEERNSDEENGGFKERNNDHCKFLNAEMEEIKGLIKKETSDVVDKSTFGEHDHIFCSRLVDTVKPVPDGVRY